MDYKNPNFCIVCGEESSFTIYAIQYNINSMYVKGIFMSTSKNVFFNPNPHCLGI
jgi:hypothetical protein